MNTLRMQSCSQEVCETTGERLFRAGEYAAPGEYMEVETARRLTLTSPDFLPARLDGHVACYRTVRCGPGTTGEPTLKQRQEQFQHLVVRLHQRLYNFARRNTGNCQDAEDVTQETLARAWRHFEQFDPQYPFKSWVFRIAKNLLIDQNRRRSLRQENLAGYTCGVPGRTGKQSPGTLRQLRRSGELFYGRRDQRRVAIRTGFAGACLSGAPSASGRTTLL